MTVCYIEFSKKWNEAAPNPMNFNMLITIDDTNWVLRASLIIFELKAIKAKIQGVSTFR